MKSINDILKEENRILRAGLAEILKYQPHYAYASASSHPDTNTAHSHIHIVERALKAADDVSHLAAGGSD